MVDLWYHNWVFWGELVIIRNNVEHDLLNILKYQRGEDVIYTILNMVNGTYKYEYSYLNKIPYDEMMIYLEKVIVLGTNSKSELVELEYTLDAIMKFADRVQFIEYSDLDKNTNLSKKYNLLIKKEKLLQLKINGSKSFISRWLKQSLKSEMVLMLMKQLRNTILIRIC